MNYFHAKVINHFIYLCIYKVWQFKNETGTIIWIIRRMLQLNSYPLQCTPLPYLYTAAFVSSIIQSSAIAHQPLGRSVAVLFSTDGKWVPFSTPFTLVFRKSQRELNPWIWRMFKYSNTFIRKEQLGQKGVVSWGIVLMQHPGFVLPEIRPLLPQGLSNCLSVNTNQVYNYSHT